MPHEQHGPILGLKRMMTRLRSRGLGEVASLGLARARENLWSSETLVLYVAETSEKPVDAGTLIPRFASADDARAFARDIGTDSAATFRARLDPTTRCFIVEEEGKILHSSWVTTGKAFTREIRGYLAPPQGDAYVYESFTRSDARGRGVYPLALAGILHRLGTEGIRDLWVGVEDSNTPSRRAISKVGFVEGFSLTYRRRFGVLLLDPPQGEREAAGEAFLRER